MSIFKPLKTIKNPIDVDRLLERSFYYMHKKYHPQAYTYIVIYMYILYLRREKRYKPCKDDVDGDKYVVTSLGLDWAAVSQFESINA